MSTSSASPKSMESPSTSRKARVPEPQSHHDRFGWMPARRDIFLVLAASVLTGGGAVPLVSWAKATDQPPPYTLMRDPDFVQARADIASVRSDLVNVAADTAKDITFARKDINELRAEVKDMNRKLDAVKELLDKIDGKLGG